MVNKTIIAALASMGAMLFVADPAVGQRQWYTLSIDGDRVGYAWQESLLARGEMRTVQHVRIEISQFRRRATLDRRLEVMRAADGRPLRISVESRAGADSGSWRGEFDRRAERLAVFAAGSRQASDVSLPANVELPDRLASALAPLWQRSVSHLRLQYLDPAQGVPTLLEARAVKTDDPRVVEIETVIAAGRSQHRERLAIDARGGIVRLEQSFFGAVLTWQACANDCDGAVARPFDPMARLTVQSPFRISTGAAKGTIRYIIARTDEREARLVETAEQSVARNGHRAVVTICDRCGSADAGTRAENLATFLAPNAWVQSTHPEIVAFARRASGSGDVARRMRGLTEAVRSRMTGAIDFLGYASALEALRHRSGDCTEIAVLLTAAARAEGIPARVVIGLVYADRFSGKKDVFSPHAWVQAWDGQRWTSYDAALDGFDATHIAIAIGDGDPSQFEDTFVQLPTWRIENAGAVKSH